ncbi:hypothetical protein Q1695_000766 [Nippostrongylus brasiliensis]|nr:hypothetical protein Q1695_000766 [Nippostrongylus brasiliensis]
MAPVTSFATNPRYTKDDGRENINETAPKSHEHKIIINQSKKESFTIHSGLRALHRRLRNAWTVETNVDEITDGLFEGVRLFILPHPRAKFNVSEMESIGRFITKGGAVLVLLSEGGEQNSDTNINFLLEEFGIIVNNDAVIRSIFYKYFDPKEALISNGVLNRSVAIAAKKNVSNDQQSNSQTISFVYPFGATLSVNRLATPVLSTGSACFPIGRPVVAFHETENTSGRLAVCGSVHMFSDQYIDKEENGKLLEAVLEFLLEGYELNKIDATEPDLSEYVQIPDHVRLSEELKVCLQEADFDMSVISDFMKCFDQSLTSFDLNIWPKVLRAYDQLQVKNEPLTLIVPQFEIPLPPLQPAVFPPNFRELPPPKLELFDLDEMFSSQEVRLAQLTNKCEETDLEFYIREAGEILGVSSSLPTNERNPKRILEHVLAQLFEFKKLGQDGDVVNAMLYDVGATQDVEAEEMFSDIEDYDDLQ